MAQPAVALKTTFVILFVVAYLGIEALVWITQVPARMTVSTFAWVSMLGLIMTGIALWTAFGGRPTRSIAHVLYDVEHPDSKL